MLYHRLTFVASGAKSTLGTSSTSTTVCIDVWSSAASLQPQISIGEVVASPAHSFARTTEACNIRCIPQSGYNVKDGSHNAGVQVFNNELLRIIGFISWRIHRRLHCGAQLLLPRSREPNSHCLKNAPHGRRNNYTTQVLRSGNAYKTQIQKYTQVRMSKSVHVRVFSSL
jgi:hypothetical protein